MVTLSGMRIKRRVSRWFIFTPVALLAWFAPANVQAEQFGVTVSVYNNWGYNNAPPLPTEDRFVGSVIQSDVWNNFDQYPMFQMYEDFAVKYEAFITAPCTCDVRFMAQADDGTILYLDNELVTNDWYDKGGGGSVSEPVSFQQGVAKNLLMWFYENGGGAWVELYWLVDTEWEIVPPSAFTMDYPQMSTTIPTTTMMPIETTSPTSTEPATTTTIETPTTHHQTTVPETTTSLLPSTLPSSVPVSTVPAPVSTDVPTTEPQTTTTILQTPATTLPDVITAEQLLSNAESMTAEELRSVVTEVLDGGVTQEEALALATSQQALATLTEEQAVEVFQTIEISELSDEEAQLLVEAVQSAPAEVRQAFENEVDVFGGKTDNYVPLGSTVPVATRRAIIAITGVLSVVSLSTTSVTQKR